MSSPTTSDEYSLDEEEIDYLLPIKQEELATLRSAVGMWEHRMSVEDDKENQIMMSKIYNRLDSYNGGLKEP